MEKENYFGSRFYCKEEKRKTLFFIVFILQILYLYICILSHMHKSLQDDTAILEEKKYMNVFHANL